MQCDSEPQITLYCAKEPFLMIVSERRITNKNINIGFLVDVVRVTTEDERIINVGE